ncbi:MAG: hypothetical protein WCY90_01200 [Bacilli bacterium]
MDLKILQPQVEEILKELGFRLNRLYYTNEGKDRYLRVIVDKYHYKISLDEIVTISERIDTLLDLNDDEEAFILDVTTTGAEKEIMIDEIKDYTNEFIEITMLDGIKGPPKIKGTLQEANESELTLLINQKGRLKKQTVAHTVIKQINRAIKFKKD